MDLENLPDSMILEFLNRFDYHTLLSLCLDPISKKINRLCLADGDVRRKILEPIQKRVDSINLYGGDPNWDELDETNMVDFDVYSHWNLEFNYYAGTPLDNSKPLSVTNNILYNVMFNISMKKLHQFIEQNRFRVPVHPSGDSPELFCELVEKIHYQKATKLELIGFISNYCPDRLKMAFFESGIVVRDTSI